MIVKVKAPGQNESWRFYDSAREVQTATGPKSLFNGEVPDDVTEDWFDDGENDEYSCITFFDNTGPRHVITNTRAYLMTDDGKTIERII